MALLSTWTALHDHDHDHDEDDGEDHEDHDHDVDDEDGEGDVDVVQDPWKGGTSFQLFPTDFTILMLCFGASTVVTCVLKVPRLFVRICSMQCLT